MAAIIPAASLKRFSLTVLEFFLPRLCLFCGAAVGADAAVAVCPQCEGKIECVASPVCPCCGLVFPSREGQDRVCGSCQTDPPPFRRARAAAVYDGPVAEAIKRFKFAGQIVYLPVMQGWLRRPYCQELLNGIDLVIPVPLHPRRLRARGFNQALLLARGLGDAPVAREALARVRHTVPQVGLNPKERRENVKAAFAVPDPSQVEGKNVLLLDDLYTTGATARECAKVLRRAGAKRVDVLTVARVRYE
jgi:ComF family protein